MNSLSGGNTASGRPTPRSATPVGTAAAVIPEVVASELPSAPAEGGGHDWGSGGYTLGSARSSGVKKDGEKKKKRKGVIELD
jgi:hypothetical protein